MGHVAAIVMCPYCSEMSILQLVRSHVNDVGRVNRGIGKACEKLISYMTHHCLALRPVSSSIRTVSKKTVGE